jgi:hypothetical protein
MENKYFLIFLRFPLFLLYFFYTIFSNNLFTLLYSPHNILGIPISLCALFVCVARKCGLGGINMVGMAGHVVLSLFRRKQINQISENYAVNLELKTNDKKEQNKKNSSKKLRKIPKKSKIYDFLDVNHSVHKVMNQNNEILNEFNDSESDSDSDNENDNECDEEGDGDKDGIISRELAKIGEFPDSFPFPSSHSQNNNSNNNYNNSNLAPGEEYYFIDIFNNGRLTPAIAHTHEAYPKSAKIEMFSRSLRNLCQKYSSVADMSRDVNEKKFLCLYQLRAIQEWEIYQTLLSLKKDKRLYRINKIMKKRRKENMESIVDEESVAQKDVKNNYETDNQGMKEKKSIDNNLKKEYKKEKDEEEEDDEEEGETQRKKKKGEKMEEMFEVDEESSLTDEEMVERVRFDLSRILDLYGQYIRLMDMMVTTASDLGE